MRLTYTGRGLLREGGQTVPRDGEFTVSDRRGEQLLADPTVSVTLATREYTHLTRDELNQLAAKAGITSPEALPNKESVIEALTHPEPEGSTHTEQEVTE